MIEASRKLQMDKRTREKEQKLKEEKDFADFWKVRNQELEMQEL
jgi:cephalosporin-C deacetylase-like acetyl esterase